MRGGDDDEETRGRQKYKLGRTGENRQHRENVKRRQERWTERKNTRGQRWKEREGGGGGGPSEGGAPSYCGRAFRMAFTSSATAVSANSNWSCGETKAGNKREEES